MALLVPWFAIKRLLTPSFPDIDAAIADRNINTHRLFSENEKRIKVIHCLNSISYGGGELSVADVARTRSDEFAHVKT
jgi:hypothetical protein